MLRGFRWQLVALLCAGGLFTLALLNRPDAPPPSTPAAFVATPTGPPTQAAPTAMPLPTLAPISDAPGSRADDVPTLREGLVGVVQRINPLLTGPSQAEDALSALVYEGLTRTNAFGEPAPALATRWVVSGDQLEFVFELRQDVLWHDGQPFTAEDVRATYALLQDPAFPGDPALGAFWRTVEVEPLGAHVVRFRLTQPLASFLDVAQRGLLPAHLLGATSASALASHPLNLQPVGTGPYQLEALRANPDGTLAEVSLRRAPSFRARPEGQTGWGLERLTFTLHATFDDALAALNSGTIDALAAPDVQQRAALLRVPNVQTHTAVAPAVGVLIFNWEQQGVEAAENVFRDARVRAALITGLDRPSIIQRNLPNLAVPADSPLILGTWAYTSPLPWPAPDVDQARALLDTASSLRARERAQQQATPDPETAPDSATTAPSDALLGFSILTPDEPALVAVAEEMAAQWSRLGLDVRVESASPDAYRARLDEGTFDTAIVQLSMTGSADPDVYSFWHQGQYPDGQNYGGVDDRRISEALERARRDPFGLNRAALYAEFQRQFAERAIAIPLYYPLFTYAVRNDVDGVQLGAISHPADRFRTLQDWQRGAPLS